MVEIHFIDLNNMNKLIIRKFEDKDSEVIARMSEDFIDYIATLDPQKRVIKRDRYGIDYLEKQLRDIKNKNGIFLVAETQNNICGYGIGLVESLEPDDLMEVLPHTPGRIAELYVDDKYRGMGIGTQLLNELESYLKEKGCNPIHIGVFVPNQRARKLYEKLGYGDRDIDMIKFLK
jgi:ribosomal protein S18 acetylase RimI-like enzyme